jgi:hypothetical protein
MARAGSGHFNGPKRRRFAFSASFARRSSDTVDIHNKKSNLFPNTVDLLESVLGFFTPRSLF